MVGLFLLIVCLGLSASVPCTLALELESSSGNELESYLQDGHTDPSSILSGLHTLDSLSLFIPSPSSPSSLSTLADSGQSDNKTHNHVHCSFTLSNQRFDLCSLFKWGQGPTVLKQEEQTPPTITTTTYFLGLGGPLVWDERLGAGVQVCVSDSNLESLSSIVR